LAKQENPKAQSMIPVTIQRTSTTIWRNDYSNLKFWLQESMPVKEKNQIKWFLGKKSFGNGNEKGNAHG